jgi:hypothetical protein
MWNKNISETTDCDIVVENRFKEFLECCTHKIGNYVKTNCPLIIILDKMRMHFGIKAICMMNYFITNDS